jgi:hypothetical protein
MSATTSTPTNEADTPQGPGGAFATVLNAAVQSAASSLEHTVGSWTDKLNGIASGDDPGSELVSLADEGIDEVTEGGGAKEKAGGEALKAKLEGKNPFKAAVAGAWQAGTPVVRAAIVSAVVAVILLLLLSPVLLLVFLLSLLIIAAVHRARSGKK